MRDEWFLNLAENKGGSGLEVEYYIDNNLERSNLA